MADRFVFVFGGSKTDFQRQAKESFLKPADIFVRLVRMFNVYDSAGHVIRLICKTRKTLCRTEGDAGFGEIPSE